MRKGGREVIGGYKGEGGKKVEEGRRGSVVVVRVELM